MSLANLITKPCWTPRAQFAPSQVLHEHMGLAVFTCGNGLYLMTNSDFGDDDPVWGVGWAESDHWALRVWSSPPFADDLIAPAATWPRPSLSEVGRPADLSFASVVAFETAHPQRTSRVGLVSARVRITDGAITHSKVNGYGKVTYCYEAPNPKPADLPVAIEFRLPG
ncbi:MAG: hypothetical protein JF587_05675 [Catenulisporales bacterium]|nr:hypothetical protein [Catenulisporales bacterium]